MTGLEEHYSARDIENRILAALRAGGLNPEAGLSPDDMGALDHFHTGGRRASRDLMELAPIQTEDLVLDIGAGLGGPARMLASARGCRVVCLDLSPDYCAAARLLNRITGLDDRVEVREGSALDLPFSGSSFDMVWMQNVGMNIADKRRLYTGIRRVLKPGGRFVFQEFAAGEAGLPYFPLPWATHPEDSYLTPIPDFRSTLEQCGFVAEVFENASDAELSRPPTGAAPGPITFAVFVDNIAEKSRNSRRSLEDGRTRLVKGVFRAE